MDGSTSPGWFGDCIVVVTGAASGIGYVTADHLLAGGGTVVRVVGAADG